MDKQPSDFAVKGNLDFAKRDARDALFQVHTNFRFSSLIRERNLVKLVTENLKLENLTHERRSRVYYLRFVDIRDGEG